MNQELTIQFYSKDEDFSFEQAKSLKNYLNLQNYADDIKVSNIRRPLEPDEAGGIIESALSVLLGKDFINGLVKSLAEWSKGRAALTAAKQKSLKIELTIGENKLLIEGADLEKGENHLVEKMLSIFEEQLEANTGGSTASKEEKPSKESLNSLKELVSKNQLGEVINTLLADPYINSQNHLQNEIIQLSRRYQKESRNERLQTELKDEIDTSQNKISDSLLNFIDLIAEA